MSEDALKEYGKYASACFYNPSASYAEANKVRLKLDEAREKLKKMLGAKGGEIIFTGGATESNNLSLKGSEREGKWEYVVSIGEHPSVLEVAKSMEKKGRVVHYIPLTKNGEIDYSFLEKVLNKKTRLVSVMLVNNVTGAINDIKRVSQLVKSLSPQAVLHVDGVQAFKKLNFSVNALDIDLLSISAHKFHGPKGVGALYVKNKTQLKNIIFGGGQEFGIRSGTENVAGIMAMVKAAEEIDTEKAFRHVKQLHDAFLHEIENEKGISVVCPDGSPYILCLLFAGVNSETLVRMLENDVVVGRGSACSSKKAGNSVLEAMGYSREQVKGALRVSFSDISTLKEVESAAKIIKEKYLELYERTK